MSDEFVHVPAPWPGFAKATLRVAAALVAAALVIALTFGMATASVMLAAYALVVAMAHLLPAAALYLALAWRKKVGGVACAVSGFVIGSIPVAILTWPLQIPPRRGSSSGVQGIPTMIDGIPTLAGWIYYAIPPLTFGALGVVGGCVFWLVVKRLHQHAV